MDVDMLMQQMQADPSMMGDAAPMPAGMLDPMADPMMAPGLAGADPGAIGSSLYPSTDPGMLAQVVQDALAQLAEQDHMQLEQQQQAAALAAQPIIDQMMQQAAMPPMPEVPAVDPMTAFGESEALPPLPPEELL